jgi:hypothetical protein
MKSVSKVTKDGFKFLTMPKMVAATGANTTYSAPAHVAIETGADGAMQTLELYASPSRPGFCNHVGRMVRYNMMYLLGTTQLKTATNTQFNFYHR